MLGFTIGLYVLAAALGFHTWIVLRKTPVDVDVHIISAGDPLRADPKTCYLITYDEQQVSTAMSEGIRDALVAMDVQHLLIGLADEAAVRTALRVTPIDPPELNTSGEL